MAVRFIPLALAIGMSMASLTGALAADRPPPPALPADAGSETGNLGGMPFISMSGMALRAEDKAAMRKLEDKQVAERRQFEDRFEAELRTLRQRQYEEREALIKTFRR